MKKLLTIVAATLAVSAQAQQAFKQFGLSAEVGTTGIGVNISVPLVTDHLVFSAGYNFPTFKYSQNATIDNAYVNTQIGRVKEMAGLYDQAIDLYNSLTSKQLPHISDDVNKVEKLSADVDAKMNFGNFKLTLQYYPTTQSSFYLTAGVFIGNGSMIDVDGQIDKNIWSVYKKAVEANNELKRIPSDVYSVIQDFVGDRLNPVKELDTAIRFNAGDKTFIVRPEDEGHFEAKLKVQKVKPYVGIGFGNSVPQRHRFSFQMELGAYYQGKPTLEGPQISDTFDPSAFSQKDLTDAMDIIEYFAWYPQITFRFTGRIF